MKNPYDELYKQVNMKRTPFGYSVDYFIWRTSKLKGELSRFIRKSGLILDVGGGFGVMAKFLPDFINIENSYINLDISIEMLKYNHYQNILAAAENLPFPDNSFDYIVMSEVLEHVRDKRMVLEKCYMILGSKGLLLLTTPRTGWFEDYKKSPFVIFLIAAWIINRVVCKLTPRPIFVSKGDIDVVAPEGVIDEPSNERWLRETLKKIGFRVLKQYRADNHVPWGKNGENKFWRLFADLFVNPKKFGHCTVVICAK